MSSSSSSSTVIAAVVAAGAAASALVAYYATSSSTEAKPKKASGASRAGDSAGSTSSAAGARAAAGTKKKRHVDFQRKAEVAHRKAELLWRKGQAEDALKMLTRGIEWSEEALAKELRIKAKQQQRDGDDGAGAEAKDAVAPSAVRLLLARLLTHRAIVLAQLEKYGESLRDAERSIHLNPLDAKSYNIRAFSLLFVLRDDLLALRSYDPLLPLNLPTGADTEINVWDKNGQSQQLAPGIIFMLVALVESRALRLQNAGDYLAAAETYDFALKFKAAKPEQYYVLRAGCYEKAGKYEQALSDLDQAITHHDSIDSHVLLADVLVKMGRWSEARQEMEHPQHKQAAQLLEVARQGEAALKRQQQQGQQSASTPAAAAPPAATAEAPAAAAKVAPADPTAEVQAAIVASHSAPAEEAASFS